MSLDTGTNHREKTVYGVLGDTLAVLREFLDRDVKFCSHQPAWPRGPLSSPAQVTVAREAVEEFEEQAAALPEDGGCLCHQGLHRQHHTWAARAWLELSVHAVDYARGRAGAGSAQLADDEERIRAYVDTWSFRRPRRRTPLGDE